MVPRVTNDVVDVRAVAPRLSRRALTRRGRPARARAQRHDLDDVDREKDRSIGGIVRVANFVGVSHHRPHAGVRVQGVSVSEIGVLDDSPMSAVVLLPLRARLCSIEDEDSDEETSESGGRGNGDEERGNLSVVRVIERDVEEMNRALAGGARDGRRRRRRRRRTFRTRSVAILGRAERSRASTSTVRCGRGVDAQRTDGGVAESDARRSAERVRSNQ